MKAKQSVRSRKLVSLVTTGVMLTQILCVPAFFAGVGTAYAASTTIQSAKMQVTIDDQFPRVIQYQWLSSGKIIYGQEDVISTVNINGVSYTPTVTFVKNAADKATYTLNFSSINVLMTVVIDVVDNVLDFKVTNIQESGSTLVQTVEFPNQSLLSIRDTQAGAKETGADIGSWNSSKEEYNVLSSKATDAAPVAKTYVILNTNELAGSIYSNAFEILANKDADLSYAGNEQRYYYQTVAKTGYKKLGVWSLPWTYRETDGINSEIVELPYAKVAITDDANGDGTLDWQDGGIAYRQIMTLPQGYDVIPKVMPEIAYSRQSLSQWPFLRTLDMIKKFYSYTDGFGQLLQYKGFQHEGHDDGFDDYGNVINKRLGGLTDLNTLVNEASQYNAYVGVHLNLNDAYPEAQHYSYDKIGNISWQTMDTGYYLNRHADSLDPGSNGLAARLSELKQNVPNLKWTYIDVYTGLGYNQWKLAKELNNNGWMIGSEMSGALNRSSIWSHVNEIESKVERFIKNNVTDQFMFDPILLTTRHASAMGYGNDKDEDQGAVGSTINDQMNVFYNQTLLFKYMQNYSIMKMNVDQALNQTTTVTFQNGLTGQVVDPGTVSNTTEGTNQYVTNNPKVELRKNGNLIATYQNQFKKKVVASSAVGYHNKTITPQLTQYLLPWDPQSETKLYHYNSVGGNTTWTLPASWAGVTSVDLYQLSDTGKTLVTTLPVTAGQVTINATANTPYVVYKHGQADAITPVSSLNFGSGGFVKDPGFDSRALNNWSVSSISGSTNHVSIQTNAAGDPYLQVRGNNGADATISQTIIGLTAGKTYQMSVWAEVKNGQTATVGVKNYGGTEVTNTMTLSNIPNKYYNSMRSTIGNNMQRLSVNFTVPTGNSSATIYMKAAQVAGSSTAEVDLDDIRVVELTNPAPPGSHYFFDDFESNNEGLGPFIPINTNKAHISDLHAGFTNDTINGNYSLKMRANSTDASSITGEMMRTIPSTVRLLPNTTYTISFPYRMSLQNSYNIAVTSGYGSGMVDLFNETIDYSKYYYNKTFTTGSANDYSIRFINNIGGWDNFIIDDFTVDLGTVAPPVETPDQTFNNGQIGGWIAAYGNGSVQAVSQQLALSTDRYETVALDQNTADIADGEMTFTITPQSNNVAGAIIRYTSPTSYTRIGFDSAANGWRYWDPQGNTGIINMPGVALTTGVPHKVKLTYTGTHYTLYVDNILSYDGNIPALKTTAGRTGFSVRNKSTVYIDNVTLQNLGASSGSTPIVPTPANAQSTPGKIVLDSYDDAYVRDGASATTNFGVDPSLAVKNDGVGYSRESYLKFDLSGVTSSVYAAQIKLNATAKGSTAPNQVVELVSDNTWSETTINWNNKPASSTVIATFTPVLGVNSFDVTSQVQSALAAGKKLSVKIHGALQVSGSSEVDYGSFENTTVSNRPVLELTVPTTSILTASADSYVRDGFYASQNFGTSATLDVKTDGTDYSREAYVKYDLTSVTGTVTSAKIDLNLTTAGATAPNQVVELVSDNSWTESGITWNNKPASSGTVLATFAPTVGVHEFDVTSQVVAAMASGKKLSIRIYSSQLLSGTTDTHYGARENTTVSNRPVLKVTTQ
ncbi:CBM96 family carbohydrate-binding protein [Paenibacillus roseipurpureus]|uniref:Endo-alpha-N-acetylgalactosaminidase family protein n=1 Tax=Paenibacillus roseopurpureus TaxID=2918901 RepID=A0AA96RIG2_9BACL|nr:endo-alpha-N-acetylgalactosaminidase family protein [Paenibacillus sp. MBLB1832]WNR42770.1 endo-alpha-N-acetylgalactosaminidase family protein [Paenibacillus sp. MBLB1832]